MVTLADFWTARVNIQRFLHQTPVLSTKSLSKIIGAETSLKCELFQKTGSFKVRGAFNTLINLPPEKKARGVVCFSSGNHAQAVAYAGQVTGIPVTAVMIEGSNADKIEACASYGAKVIIAGKNSIEASAKAYAIMEEQGCAFVHPFDALATIVGQGTLGLEILEALPDVDAIYVPIGGGGLISGIAAAVKMIQPAVRVIGVQPEDSASMLASLRQGAVTQIEACRTMADGLRAQAPGENTFKFVQRYVDDVITVSEEQIGAAMLLVMTRAKLFAEPSAAVTVAGLISGKAYIGKKNVAVLSGGNVNLDQLAKVISARTQAGSGA